MSPSLIPPLSEGLPGATLATKAPLALPNFSISAISFETFWILTPNQPLLVSPNSINWSITCFALFDGIAKPIPIDPCWPSIAVFIPITSPFILNKGPPEFPVLIDASVWMKSSYLDNPIFRFLAEIIPEVTVPPNPKGFPIAITQSPILALSEFPNLTGWNLSSDLIFKTATSDSGSAPIISALYSLSLLNLTTISSAPLITWLFVITVPLLSITKPEPKALAFLFCGEPNSLNISPKGDPGGNSNGKGFVFCTTVVVVEIFTTDGINSSAKSAKEAGLSCEFVGKIVAIENNKIKVKYFFKITLIKLSYTKWLKSQLTQI